VTDNSFRLEFDQLRVETLLERLERMAAGERTRLPISPARDALDAIAYAVNVLGDELHYTNARAAEAEHQRAQELQVAKDRAERANEAKSVFLRTASHEIRTPIAAILGIADQLSYSVLSDDDRALVDQLRANSRALLSLVGNVLDLSRLDADKLALNLERVSPFELTCEVVKSIESEAQKKKLSVRVESDVPASVTIETDRVRLRQILVNVVANAIKFTTHGAVHITLKVEVIYGEPRMVIDVSDTGIGVNPEQREFLFEPFGQANAATAPVHGGAGLGLALSSRLANRLGGSLELKWSEPGKGSTFRLTLGAPIEDALTATDPEVSQGYVSPLPAVLEGIHVLLADDHPDLRMALGRSLKLQGASVTYARDGGEVLTLVKNGAFDVVVMDILMPVMNGLQATRALRADGNRVPVIAISADAAPEMRALTVDAGCDAQMTKPFDPFELAELIQGFRRASIDGNGAPVSPVGAAPSKC
jgi:signal transduction histidine kinase/ActR/RegA family two-component response regulator